MPLDLGQSAAAVGELVSTLERYVKDLGPHPVLPKGIRLEIHPSVHYIIRANYQPEWVLNAAIGEEPTPFPPEIPVKITMDLPRNAWRLVIVQEDVILTGTMPEPLPGYSGPLDKDGEPL